MAIRVGMLWEILVIAFDTLRANKMRSALTILGVVIGVMSIVAMTALITGFGNNLESQIRAFGSNTVFVQKLGFQSFSSGRSFLDLIKRPNLTNEDARAIGDSPLVDEVGLQIGGGGPFAAIERMSFAGQAEDPFFLDLRVFDLLYGGDLSEVGDDTLAGFNVNAVALKVDTKQLTSGKDPVIGIWSTTSRKDSSGSYRQVSRLGMPLVNEVVVPLKDKDRFNASRPADDAQFLQYVTDPELARLIEAIYGIPAPATPRNDLVQVFLTGVPGLNQPKSVTPSEQLRLNTAIAPSAKPTWRIVAPLVTFRMRLRLMLKSLMFVPEIPWWNTPPPVPSITKPLTSLLFASVTTDEAVALTFCRSGRDPPVKPGRMNVPSCVSNVCGTAVLSSRWLSNRVIVSADRIAPGWT